MESGARQTFDVVVMGGGAAGLTVAAGAASFGMRTALIERQPELGGDCLHSGCVPSKTLIAAAKTYASIFTHGPVPITDDARQQRWQAARGRVEAAIAHIQQHDSHGRFRKLGVTLVQGDAVFLDEYHVQADEHLLTAPRIVIATGSAPRIPAIAGLEACGYLTNQSLFRLDRLPKRLAIIGAGAIGVELGQALARLGSEVTLIEARPSLFPDAEPMLSQWLQAHLERELTVLTNTTVQEVAALSNGERKLQLQHPDDARTVSQQTLVCDQILLAAGREPNTASLRLERAGVDTLNGFIRVNQRLQTSQTHIYAAGDVLSSYAYTHVASMEAKIVLANALFGLRKSVHYDHVPRVMFTDPEWFEWGLTERQAREKWGDSIKVYELSMSEVDRFVIDGAGDGYLKVITDRRGRLLGAHALAVQASAWMQELLFAARHGHRLADIATVIHPYPSYAGALQQLADQYWRDRLFSGSWRTWLGRWLQILARFRRHGGAK